MEASKIARTREATTFDAEHIAVSIARRPADVYEFVSNPENLPTWAAGLSASIRKIGEDWVAESPMGSVKVRFADRNEFGILDHVVTLPSGAAVSNPMRVFPNHEGSELVFTIYRRPGMSDEEFRADANAVKKDLNRLKAILER